MTVRRIKDDETLSASKLEKECLFCPWSKSEIDSFIKNEHSVYLVAEKDGVIAGICSATVGAGECSIDNIAVGKEYRRSGIASALIESLFDFSRRNGCDEAYLEVAEDNENAIALYKKYGFFTVGRRPHFYGNTDALLMKSEEI